MRDLFPSFYIKKTIFYTEHECFIFVFNTVLPRTWKFILRKFIVNYNKRHRKVPES